MRIVRSKCWDCYTPVLAERDGFSGRDGIVAGEICNGSGGERVFGGRIHSSHG